MTREKMIDLAVRIALSQDHFVQSLIDHGIMPTNDGYFAHRVRAYFKMIAVA
jgi:hypothetical protein